MENSLNVTLRTESHETTYLRDKEAGNTTPLELVKSIRQWEHWRLIDNDYPYNIAFKTHHMLLPKRAEVAERWDLNQAERAELETILKEFVYPNYDLWFENTPKRRSMNHIYHLHVASYWDNRGEMSLI